MAVNAPHRTSVVRSLLPIRSEGLLDVGCGPLTAAYPYADKARHVTCVDWNLMVFGSIPTNIEYLKGDFTQIELEPNYYDCIIAADVFEHIALEQEPAFAKKCVSVLRPGGHLVISVPHLGTFAFLDPYSVKPAIHRLLWQLGLYKDVHNGNCDIRKGHKHYRVEQLIQSFKPLELLHIVYYGYFFDPLLTWAVALSRGSRQFPGYKWIEQACSRELERDYGQRSFNVALKFCKPTELAIAPAT